MHPCVIFLFQMKPARCTLFLSIFISTSVHASGNYVPIIRRTFCICVTLVFFTLCGWQSGVGALYGWLSGVGVLYGWLSGVGALYGWLSGVGALYGWLSGLGALYGWLSGVGALYGWLSGVGALYGWLSGLQTRQPPIQSEKYQWRINTVSSPDDGHIVGFIWKGSVQINTTEGFCINFFVFTMKYANGINLAYYSQGEQFENENAIQFTDTRKAYVIWGFCRKGDGNCVLLGYYAARSGNYRRFGTT